MTSAFDVAVVGGGIAGVSIACELAVDASVVLLEREPQLAHHTTGRSAAIYAESYEAPEVRDLTRASRAGFAAAARESGTPVLTPRPTLWVAEADDGAELERLALDDPSLVPITCEEAETLCPALEPGWVGTAAVDARAHDIDVPALHQHYVRVGRARGLEIRAATRVDAACRQGGTWLIEAGGEQLRAGRVVNAAGAWADSVAAVCGIEPLGMRPLRRTAVVARASARDIDPAWPFVIDVAERFYFRPEGPHLLCSPEDETPSPPCDARPDEIDVALALDRVNAATRLGLRSVVRAWAGLRTFSPDRLPVVGADRSDPSFVWCAGQGGFGIMTAPAMAALGAALTLERSPLHPALATRLSPTRF